MYQLQVSFGEAISRAFRKYCCFTGRASRSEYWWFYLFTCIIGWVSMMISVGMNYSEFSLLATDPNYADDPEAITAIMNIYTFPAIISLAIFLPSFGLLFRRLHDTGHSGWWWLLTFVPIIGGIVILVFTLQPSQMFDNKYGPVPNLSGDQLPPPFPR